MLERHAVCKQVCNQDMSIQSVGIEPRVVKNPFCRFVADSLHIVGADIHNVLRASQAPCTRRPKVTTQIK